MPARFQQLDQGRIITATREIAARIRAQFPDKGLAEVAEEVMLVAKDAAEVSVRNGRPAWGVRILAAIVTGALMAGVLLALVSLRVSTRIDSISDLAQGVEATVNNIVFAGIAIWFVFSIESRRKRGRTLRLMSRLRSLAHVIDLHQVTKDPDQVIWHDPAATPTRPALSKSQMPKYLAHCSELLSIIGKLAALSVQRFHDTATLGAVDEIQDLVNGLSHKIWQKINIIDLIDLPQEWGKS